jgi:hypothetical protein
MQACTFTSNLRRTGIVLALGFSISLLFSSFTLAGAEDSAPATDRTQEPQDEDFSSNAYTQFGDFDEEAEEAVDAKFFKYGRFFGMSAGSGFQGVTGNRGALWQGGFPMVDFKVHYWFDFNFAMDLNVFYTTHSYTLSSSGSTDVRMNHLGVNFKYYIDTQDLSAAISFAHPYFVGGIGSLSKTEKDLFNNNPVDSDTALSFSAGAGLEFAIKNRRSYLFLEAKLMSPMTFKDTLTTEFKSSAGLPDLKGLFYTTTASLLLTW